MTEIDKQLLLQKINNEITLFKTRINSIINDDSKDDFLKTLEIDDIGKTPLGGVFPSKSEKDITIIQQQLLKQVKEKSNIGTAPLGSAVPEDKVRNYIVNNFKYCNDYVIQQTNLLLKSRIADFNKIEKQTINTAYLIVITRNVLFNNYKKNILPYFYNGEIFINCQDEILKIRTNINIDADWLQASVSHYIDRMNYKITRISIN